MITLTKEWLQQTIAELEEERDATPGAVNEDAANALAAMKLALASLEAEPVSVNDDMAYAFHHAISDSSLGSDEVEEIKAGLRAAFANVTAPPAPISVPAAMEMDDDFDSSFEHGKAVGWNAYRAAMLHGAERVTTAYKLPFEQWLSQQTGTIDVECGCVMTEVFFHWLRVAYEAGNSPVIPDGWVKCSERMPDPDSKFRVCAYTASPHEDLRFRFVPASLFKSVCRDATHWQYMPLPAALQQEAK